MAEDDKKDDNVSDEFKNKLDSLVTEMEAKYSHMLGGIADTTIQQFQKRPRNRRKNRVVDEAEGIGFNASDFETLTAEETLNVVKDIKLEKKLSGPRMRSLDKFIFTDTFGEDCAVFSCREGKVHLNRMLSIQENCVKELSKASGVLWNVYGYNPKMTSMFGLNKREKIGEVFCVGLGNAMVLANVLCDRKQYKLADISVNKDFVQKCC